MLRLILCSLLLAAGHLFAQTKVTELPLEGATRLHVSANFSGVAVTTGTGSAITVEHILLIDGVPQPELTALDITRAKGTIVVEETNPTQKQLESEWRKSATIINGKRRHYHDGRNVEVQLTVTVPVGVEVTVETVYGDVEVTDVAGLREIHATYGPATVVYDTARPVDDLKLFSNYGSVDLTLPGQVSADLELKTEFGALLTDFDVDIDAAASSHGNFHEHVVGNIGGGGTRVQCTAPYGKVYLRKGI